MGASNQQSFDWTEKETIENVSGDLVRQDQQQAHQWKTPGAIRSKGEFTCDECGRKFIRNGEKLRLLKKRLNTSSKALKFCSNECNTKYQKLKASNGELRSQAISSSGKVPRMRQLLERLESNSYRCELSGVELTPDSFAIDHVVPVSSGGTNDADNLQIVHGVVNRMKGTMSQAEFIDWCIRIAEHAKQKSECKLKKWEI